MGAEALGLRSRNQQAQEPDEGKRVIKDSGDLGIILFQS